MDAMDKKSVEEVAKKVKEEFGGIDALLNAAGGNREDATTSNEVSFLIYLSSLCKKLLCLTYLVEQ